MTADRTDTAETPGVVERAAEAFAEAWDAGVPTWEGSVEEYTRHCMQALADAGLLARPLPSRDDIAELLSNWLDEEPVDSPRAHLPLADALLELLGGGSRG
jgi:hypothetical protein